MRSAGRRSGARRSPAPPRLDVRQRRGCTAPRTMSLLTCGLISRARMGSPKMGACQYGHGLPEIGMTRKEPIKLKTDANAGQVGVGLRRDPAQKTGARHLHGIKHLQRKLRMSRAEITVGLQSQAIMRNESVPSETAEGSGGDTQCQALRPMGLRLSRLPVGTATQ